MMALREPDMAMIGAAVLEAGQIGNDEVARIYRAMIDSAKIE